MVYNTQNYWGFGLLLKTRKHKSFGNLIGFCPQAKGETPSLLGPLERGNLNHQSSDGWMGRGEDDFFSEIVQLNPQHTLVQVIRIS
jgi:hypothetical protein